LSVRYAIFASEGESIPWVFLRNGGVDRLAAAGLDLGAIVIDTNESKRRNPLDNAIRVARRRARLTQSSLPRAFLRGAAYRLLVRGWSTSLSLPDPTCPILHVGSLNDGAAAAMVRDQDCDVVCLMGTRILTARTLSDLGRPAINIHSSDPGLIRGGPPVVWEVLGGLDAATLTIHEVVPEVAAGRILIQQAHEISFAGGLGRTVARTMENALDPVAGLFEAALRGLQAGTIVPQDFVPGPFRTIPSIREMIKADRICRRKSGSGPRGGSWSGTAQ
jgi:hypothetical protein